METTLQNIALIQTGVFAKPLPKGEIVYLQAKHFDEFGQLNSILHPDLKHEGISEKHILKDGDILFAAKGTKNFAALYEQKSLPAVASTSFFVIRIQEEFRDKVLPEFLVWFIKQPNAQKFLKGEAYGTAIVSIPKSVLEVLEIPLPDIQTQKAILTIAELRNTERTLRQKIETLRESQIEQQIFNALK